MKTMIKHHLKKSQETLEMIKQGLNDMPEFMKKGYGQRIADARDKRGLKNIEIAKALRVTAQAVTNWIKEKNPPTVVHLGTLASILKVPEHHLRYGSDILVTSNENSLEHIDKGLRRIALLELGTTNFSNLKNAMKQAVAKSATYPVYNQIEGLVAFTIKDLSMAPEYRPPDVILVDTDAEFSPGDLSIIDCQPLKQTIFRKIQHREGGLLALVPLNQDFETHTFPRAQLGTDYHVLGVVDEHVRKVRRRDT